MSEILKRIQQARKEEIPEEVNQGITDIYLSELREKEYKNAYSDLQNKLVEASNQAELDGSRLKIESLEIANQSTHDLLTEALSKIAKQDDLIMSMQADIRLNNEHMSSAKEENENEMAEYQDMIKTLQMSLVKAESGPTEIIREVTSQEPLPSFTFTPVRGTNGMIETVTATPI
jgi:hypothetical protein